MKRASSNPVVHLELHTGDLRQARAYYAELCGWPQERIDAREGSYLALEMGDGLGGGIVECGTDALAVAAVRRRPGCRRRDRARAPSRRLGAARPARGTGRLAQRGRDARGRRDRVLAIRSDEFPVRARSLLHTTEPGAVRTMTPETIPDDRSRWLALYVLCVGMLMIVLDVTVVNVALPSIQDDLGFSQSSLAWVVNAYLIAFGGLLLLAGRLGDLIGRRIDLPRRPGPVHGGVAAVRRGAEPGDAGRRAVPAGDRRRDDLRGDPGDDRDDVPGAAGAGEGDRRVRVRGVCGRLGRPARRRRAHAGDQLALDLLHQRPDRDRDRADARCGCSRTTAASASARAPTCRAPC